MVFSALPPRHGTNRAFLSICIIPCDTIDKVGHHCFTEAARDLNMKVDNVDELGYHAGSELELGQCAATEELDEDHPK